MYLVKYSKINNGDTAKLTNHKNNVPTSKTFCAAPWFMIRNSNAGDYNVCCKFNKLSSNFEGKKEYDINNDPDEWVNSDYMSYIRNNLYNGNKISECDYCWKRESAGERSLREIYNEELLGNKDITKTFVRNYFKKYNHDDYGFLIGGDIKLNNICNFACTMCGPSDSSVIYTQWKKQRNHKKIKKELEIKPQNYLDKIYDVYKENKSKKLLNWVINQPNLKLLKILGGEPLLDKTMLATLCEVENKNKTKIMFVTNGSVNIKNVCDILSDFKFLYFVVSIDAFGDFNSYIRKNSNWESLSKNVIEASKISKCKVSIHSTLQALSLKSIPDLISWCKEHNVDWEHDLCESPEYLSINALPERLFKNYCNAIKKHDANLATFLELQYNDLSIHHKKDLKEHLEWYDSDSLVAYSTLYPELVNFFNNN